MTERERKTVYFCVETSWPPASQSVTNTKQQRLIIYPHIDNIRVPLITKWLEMLDQKKNESEARISKKILTSQTMSKQLRHRNTMWVEWTFPFKSTKQDAWPKVQRVCIVQTLKPIQANLWSVILGCTNEIDLTFMYGWAINSILCNSYENKSKTKTKT